MKKAHEMNDYDLGSEVAHIFNKHLTVDRIGADVRALFTPPVDVSAELATVRADITRTALVVQALAVGRSERGISYVAHLESLLSRERELMGKVSR